MEFKKPGNKTAISWKDIQISYADLGRQVTAYAETIKSVKDERIAIFAENRPEWAYAFFAGWKNQNVVVPLDHLCKYDEAAYILKDCQPAVIFYSNKTAEVLQQAIKEAGYQPQTYNLDEMDFDIREMEIAQFPQVQPEKTAVIIYTSGTTGSPKGVMLSFKNLLSNIDAVSKGVPIYHQDQTVLLLLPLHHVFPLLGSLIAPLYTGGTVAITPSLDAEDIINTLQSNKVTIVIGVPRFYAMIRQGIMDKINSKLVTKLFFKLAEKVNSQNFSRKIFKKVQDRFGGHIEFLVSGGAKLDEDVGRDLQTMGFEVLEGFGMTEAAPMITFTRPGRVKIGAAGEAMPNMEVEIRNGEVVARGPNIMQGYYNNPQATSQVLKDGWLHTGDQGYLDEEGYLHITGRIKDIIVPSNGKNINPEELEKRIYGMTDLISEIGIFLDDDTLQAAVYPNLTAFKDRVKENIEEIIEKEVIEPYNQLVSSFKKIRKFHIINNELPKTRLSKIKRFQLPEMIRSMRDPQGSKSNS